MKKILNLRKVRKEQSLTLRELAKKSAVNYSSIWQLEHGFGDSVGAIIKAKIASALRVEMFSLFPEERRKAERIFSSHRFRMLLDFLPEIRFISPKATDKILKQMALDELDDLFHSGLTEEEAIEQLQRAAKKYDLPMPEIR